MDAFPEAKELKMGALLWFYPIQEGSCFKSFAAPCASVICSLSPINGNGWKTCASSPPGNALLWICSSLGFVLKWKNMNFGALHLKQDWKPLRKLKCHLQTRAPTRGLIHGHGEGLQMPHTQTFPLNEAFFWGRRGG